MFHTIQFAGAVPADRRPCRPRHFAGWGLQRARSACAFLLFVGAMGKSAQFFLHLAAGRDGRTNPGVGPDPRRDHGHRRRLPCMVCLLSPLFEYTPQAKVIVTLIEAVTALFAATIGLAQNDIKRVIAYSTCSQLGYMFFAAGVGAYQASMFHLFTHAFFKALLFLAAGSVITGMHHEQDMRAMGGLWKLMPITYAVMLIGTLAITGVPIPIGGHEYWVSPASTPRTPDHQRGLCRRQKRGPANPLGEVDRLLRRPVRRRPDQLLQLAADLRGSLPRHAPSGPNVRSWGRSWPRRSRRRPRARRPCQPRPGRDPDFRASAER